MLAALQASTNENRYHFYEPRVGFKQSPSPESGLQNRAGKFRPEKPNGKMLSLFKSDIFPSVLPAFSRFPGFPVSRFLVFSDADFSIWPNIANWDLQQANITGGLNVFLNL